MSTHRTIRLLHCWLLRQRRSSGFTLTELLISIVMVAIILSVLLALVVELLQIDRREANLDRVQQDMQRAMDYMQDDLREAVYVYPDPQTIAAQLGADPQFPDAADDIPVLAFWRLDPLESEDDLPVADCSAWTVGTDEYEECQVLRIRQAVYTLVLYVQRPNDGNANWLGQSRIIRYELSKYSNPTNLTQRSGYRDPTDPNDPLAPFEAWRPDGAPRGFSAVLVDFVDSPTAELDRPPLSDAPEPCSAFNRDINGDGTDDAVYQVAPNNASTTLNTSFFACVLDPDPDRDTGTTARANQDVYLFLRGNANTVAGTPGLASSSETSSLPTLETQVMVRGVIDKSID